MCLTCSTKSWVLLIWCWDLPTKGLRILVSSLATPYVTDPQLSNPVWFLTLLSMLIRLILMVLVRSWGIAL